MEVLILMNMSFYLYVINRVIINEAIEKMMRIKSEVGINSIYININFKLKKT